MAFVFIAGALAQQPIAPCLATANGLPQVPYAIDGATVRLGGLGYALRDVDGYVACISARVWTIRGDGSCTAWSWMHTAEGQDVWKPSTAQCAVGEQVSIQDPELPWPIVLQPIGGVWHHVHNMKALQGDAPSEAPPAAPDEAKPAKGKRKGGSR